MVRREARTDCLMHGLSGVFVLSGLSCPTGLPNEIHQRNQTDQMNQRAKLDGWQSGYKIYIMAASM